MIQAVKVLNTVTAFGTDVSVDSSGILNIAGVAATDVYNVRNVLITTPVAAVAGVVTITPTAANSTAYTFYISGFSKSTGLAKVMQVSFTSAASATATTITTQAKAIINADTDFSVAATGTATIILTSATGYSPEFVVGGSLASVTSLGGDTQTIFTNLSAVNGTVGVQAVGTPALLQAQYGYDSNSNTMTYADMANLTTGYYYTTIEIDWISTAYTGSSAFKGEISTNKTVVFVQQGTVAGTVATANYNDLLGTYGTVTGLQAGYRVVGALMTAATATSTNTSGVQTLNSGGLGTVNGVIGGDYIVSVSTPVVHKVISTLTENTYLASTTTTLTASSPLNSFKWRALPL